MMKLEEKFPLKGFIDTHLHTAPDIKPRLLSDVEAANRAREEKMGAIVIKSHGEPTSGRAILAERITGIPVLGGVCLNCSVGGLNVEAVKTAALMGGKMVWLPTISKDKIDISRKDSWDKLEDIFTVMIDYELILATGHLSVSEIFQVLDLARERGLKKIIINHPLTRVVNASIEEQKDMARNAYLEHCYVACLPKHDKLDPQNIADAIRYVGAHRCIMATDFGQMHNHKPTEGLKEFINIMMGLNISWKEIQLMCQQNPYQLLFK